jgi:ABC-type nitrate/sulfonate/bicarbonate transport system substrate-binding protein
MQKTTRRQFVRQVASTFAGIMVSGPSLMFARSRHAKIAVYAPSHCSLPAVHAFHSHYYKKNGVNVEIVYCKEMPEILNKLCAGEVEFAQLMSPMILHMHSGQMKAKKTSLAVTQVLGTNGGILGISTNSKISKIQDLAGKTIGVHSPLMVHHLIMRLLLEKYGLTQQNIQIKTVPMHLIREALLNGEIDAFINPEPLPTLLESQTVSRSLLLTRMFWLNHPCCLLTCRQSFFEKNQQMVEDITRATTTSCLMLDNIAMRKSQIEKIYAIKTPFNKIPLDKLQQAFAPRRSDFYPFPFLSAAYVIIEQMKKARLLPESIDVKATARDVFKSDFSMRIIKQAASLVPGTSIPSSTKREETFKLI